MLVDLVQTMTSDGVRLDGILQTPPAGPAPRLDGFCLVHGTGSNFYSSTLFDAFAERVLAQGSAVLRINTRGHDVMSNAHTTRGGRRLGAAYEVVDDCRHDLAAWGAWLADRVGPRIALVGHSLGAVKCLYAAAHDPRVQPACIVAISPPRLSYAWFCGSPEGPQFLASYAEADRLVQAGQPQALIEVKLPLPLAIAAGGYVEKYGPEERYNYLRFLPSVSSPTLITLGSIEVENNMAFRGLPEALTRLRERNAKLAHELIAGADHFYTGVREALSVRIESWLPA